MKILSKIAIGTALLMMVAAALPPAQAACGSPILLDTRGENLISNPDWCGGGGVGCYEAQSGPPVSANIKGVFWSLGTGNPIEGLGDDSGSFTGGLGSGDSWIKQVSEVFATLYHYPAFATLKDGPSYASGNPVNWSLPVDGCVEANPDPNPCTCMLLTDEWNGQGYFAVLGSRRSPNFDLTTGGDIVFGQIPDAVITDSSTDIATADVTVNVSAGMPAVGNYAKDGCDCIAGFRVFANIVPRGSAPPTSRSAGWAPIDAGATPFGGTASATADCDPATEQDLYLGVAIAGANGSNPTFENLTVSSNSTRIPCGANLADPGRPGRGKRGTDPRPDRGRDGDRRGGR